MTEEEALLGVTIQNIDFLNLNELMKVKGIQVPHVRSWGHLHNKLK